MRTARFALLMIVAVVALVQAASGQPAAKDDAFFGKWKLSAQKSAQSLSNLTITFSKTSDGSIQSEQADLKYTFRTDGAEHKTPFGTTEAWRQIDERTWEATVRQNGKVLKRSTYVVSGDGKTMLYTEHASNGTAKQMKPVTFRRTGGESGLLGTWQPTNLADVLSDMQIEITPRSDGGFVYKDEAGTCNATFGGKDCTFTGGDVAGVTARFERTGPNSFRMIHTQNGKKTFTSDVTVSADGRTLTVNSTLGSDPKTAQKSTLVYERQ